MKSEFRLRARDHLHSSEQKRHYNREHFAESAPRYDLATGLLSLGRDRSWKRKLVGGLPDIPKPTCVDLACGTGDVAFLLSERYRDSDVLGIDLTAEMIALAKQRRHDSRVDFRVGDMCDLEVESRSVDIVTGSYAIRNAPDLEEALTEFRRVLRPGGWAAFLDFSKPTSRILQSLQFGLLKFWGGLWGLLLHGNPEIHGYISESLRTYPDSAELEKTFISYGFRIERSASLMSGMMMLYFLTLSDSE